MELSKRMSQVASLPALAISVGMRSALIVQGNFLICHPCHCFEESILNSHAKRVCISVARVATHPFTGYLEG
jgi:hypothetical protein